MEDLFNHDFRVVQKIQLKKYQLVLDRHDIQDIIVNSLDVVSRTYESKSKMMYSAALVQILQKLSTKQLRFSKKHIATCKITLSAVEYYAMRELIDQTPIDNMPTFHSILVQLDTQ